MLDLTKPLILTETNKPARYLGALIGTDYPLVFAVVFNDREEIVCTDKDGNLRGLGNKITNIPEPKRSGEVWVLVYDDAVWGYVYSTYQSQSDADAHAAAERPVARFSYMWTEGEGSEGK